MLRFVPFEALANRSDFFDGFAGKFGHQRYILLERKCVREDACAFVLSDTFSLQGDIQGRFGLVIRRPGKIMGKKSSDVLLSGMNWNFNGVRRMSSTVKFNFDSVNTCQLVLMDFENN